ncbi:peptidase [Melaminivora suipulveris]|uniref:Peptidase n=1 Tax=Melaminivora suipulveris TaxID=2109913 RepID=A0A2R3QCX2_9BURK|nr:PepSY domain-containing protein [Melaminivora suipulveris]AVO49507.1 peptidase [Melaminivora suipulveris]
MSFCLSRFAQRLAAPLLMAALAASGAALHAGESDHERARRALERGEVLPLRAVLEQVERTQQGQVLKIEFERDDGRYLYKIRLLQPDGRVAKLKVDAVDGRVLSVKRKGS